jgi:hypothetical protein
MFYSYNMAVYCSINVNSRIKILMSIGAQERLRILKVYRIFVAVNQGLVDIDNTCFEDSSI